MLPMKLRDALLATLALTLSAPGCKANAEGDAPPVAKAELDAQGFPEGPYPDRDPALAKQLVDAGALLLDVRTPEEFASGHVDGAINIPHTEVPNRIDEIRELVGGEAHKPVVVYCRSGRRSGIAKKALERAGFDRVTNLGGLKDWPG
jgi:phage shock protein E